MELTKFRKKIDSRRRTQGLAYSSELTYATRDNGEPYGVLLTVGTHTSPMFWLEVVRSCDEFAIAEINSDVSQWAKESLDTGKLSILFLPREGELARP